MIRLALVIAAAAGVTLFADELRVWGAQGLRAGREELGALVRDAARATVTAAPEPAPPPIVAVEPPPAASTPAHVVSPTPVPAEPAARIDPPAPFQPESDAPPEVGVEPTPVPDAISAETAEQIRCRLERVMSLASRDRR